MQSQPIQHTEIEAYVNLESLTDPNERRQLTRAVEMLDFLWREQQAAERDDG